MRYLGHGYKPTNHHLVITEEEQNMLVNALTFFHDVYSKRQAHPVSTLIEDWQLTADDTNLADVDALATKIATLP